MRLTSIEKLHFFDDSELFPNNIFGRIRFQGRVDKKKALAAIEFVQSQHPLIAAMVEGDGNRLTWNFEQPLSESVLWIDGLEFPGYGYLDLKQKLSTQFVMLAGEDESHLWVQGHHAAFDGGAAAKALSIWMTAYQNLCTDQPIERGIAKVDESLLPLRNALGLLKWSYLRHLHLQPIALFGATKFLFRQFGLLTNSIVNRSNPVVLHDVFPTVISRWVDAETVTELNEQANRYGVMLNTLLMAKLYLALWKLRTSNQFGRPNDWIRILLPMSIRTMSDRRLPAANRSAVVQVDRRPQHFEDFPALLAGIDQEVGIIHRWQLHKMFLIAVRAMSAIPFWLKSSAKNDKYRGTIVFTNLGNVFSRNRKLQSEDGLRAGNLKLLDFDLVGPIRRGIGVNLSVQQHEDRMRLSVHVDPRQVDVATAEEFLDAFIKQMTELENKTV